MEEGRLPSAKGLGVILKLSPGPLCLAIAGSQVPTLAGKACGLAPEIDGAERNGTMAD